MPSSNPETIPVIINLIWKLSPKSVLDIGTGLGKYGVLFREYLELKHRPESEGNESDFSAIFNNRQVIIDGVEGFPKYIGKLQKITYDNIFNKNIIDFTKDEWSYDFIFSSDVFEHIDKTAAMKDILPILIKRAKMGVLISVPSTFHEQEAVFDNPLEEHRSVWHAEDFKSLAPYTRVGYKGSHLIAFMTKDEKVFSMVKGNTFKRKLNEIKNLINDTW